jgi:hypothetical protein
MKYLLGILVPFLVNGQDTAQQKKLLLDFFVESYYSYDLNQPPDHEKPSFVYSHNRHNEFNVNLAVVKADYSTDRVRGSLGLMGGTYAEKNLSAEPALLRHFFQAYAGLRIPGKREIWVDAGIFPSHIGFETAVASDCWTLTRSILADNSPYYESGLRSTYTEPGKKWSFSVLLLNGWQRIRKADYNRSLSFGTQFTCTWNDKLTINSSSFIGNDKPDSARQTRYFHNFYAIYQPPGRLGITVGLDAGMEERPQGKKMNYWYAPIVILRYQPGPTWNLAGRLEYFRDVNHVIISSLNNQPCKLAGISMNIDRIFGEHVMVRLEAKYLKNGSPFFLKDNRFVRSQSTLTSSMAFNF